jgi:hypothetical protein
MEAAVDRNNSPVSKLKNKVESQASDWVFTLSTARLSRSSFCMAKNCSIKL